MNLHVLVLFLGIIMISSTISISSSEAFLPENLPDQSQAPSQVRVIEGDNLIAYARALYTSLDDPSNHVVPTINPHDGVAKLILTRTDFSGPVGCSGTLASDRLHIITAAHCITDNNGFFVLTSGSATFNGDSESITVQLDVTNSLAHPSYDGDYIKGNDIAILKLVTSAPAQIPGINHATSGDAVGSDVDKSGYGLSGFFSTGTDRSTYPFGDERSGQNKYDAFADTMYSAFTNLDFIPEAIYQFDSDDGTSKHDAFGFFFGISDTGLGDNEVMSASGDSGGPTILNGELVGVTSYGITLEYTRGPPSSRTSDCTTQLDSSCGEFAGDTRVSAYADWIDFVLTPEDVDFDSPVITSIKFVPSSTTATITWNTDEPSTSLVNYGTDHPPYGSSELDTSYVTSHSVELTGLSSSTDYHFTVTSVDTSTNFASSDDTHFRTESPPMLVSIIVSPDNPSITEGSTQQFTVTGIYDDESTQVLTAETWSSSDNTIATIDANGLATGISAGLDVTITANSGVFSGTASLDVTAAPEDPTTVSVSSITYGGEGGKNADKHLLITIALVDDLDGPVSGASVSITIKNINTGGSWSGTAPTGSDGSITFSLKNAPSGCYITTVIDVDAGSSLPWDGATPTNEECKQQTNNAKNSTPSVIKSKN